MAINWKRLFRSMTRTYVYTKVIGTNHPNVDNHFAVLTSGLEVGDLFINGVQFKYVGIDYNPEWQKCTVYFDDNGKQYEVSVQANKSTYNRLALLKT